MCDPRVDSDAGYSDDLGPAFQLSSMEQSSNPGPWERALWSGM